MIYFLALRAIVTLFFSTFFQSSFSHGKFIPTQLYLFIKDLIFEDLFLFLHDVTRLLQRIENMCYLFYWWALLLLFCFLSNQENLYTIHHDSDLFYDIYNTIHEHNRRQTHYFSSILNYFDIYF